jgi:hypothetical protein
MFCLNVATFIQVVYLYQFLKVSFFFFLFSMYVSCLGLPSAKSSHKYSSSNTKKMKFLHEGQMTVLCLNLTYFSHVFVIMIFNHIINWALTRVYNSGFDAKDASYDDHHHRDLQVVA